MKMRSGHTVDSLERACVHLGSFAVMLTKHLIFFVCICLCQNDRSYNEKWSFKNGKCGARKIAHFWPANNRRIHCRTMQGQCRQVAREHCSSLSICSIQWQCEYCWVLAKWLKHSNKMLIRNGWLHKQLAISVSSYETHTSWKCPKYQTMSELDIWTFFLAVRTAAKNNFGA